MALLEQKPIHVRKKIALGVTLICAFVLIVALVIVYTSKKPSPKGDSAIDAFRRFYATFKNTDQSTDSSNSAIIPK